MRYRSICFIGMAMIAFFMHACAPAGTMSERCASFPFRSERVMYEDTSLTSLANGLTVLVHVDRRFPTVSTRLYVRTGSTMEHAEEAGISHLLEHMVFRGTKTFPDGTISRYLENAGAYLNAATSFDYTVYVNDLPAGEWRKGLEAVSEMAFDATIDPGHLASEKGVVLAELRRGLDNPRSVLFQTMQRKVLAGTPYERPIIGFEDSVRGIGPSDIRRHIDKWYQPRNMLLVVVGDVDADKVVRKAAGLFGSRRNKGTLDAVLPIDVKSMRPATGVTVLQGPWNKAYFAMGFPVPGVGDEQSAKLDVLADMLGGDDTSILVRKYRHEMKLVHSIDVGNVSFARLGMFLITAELDPENIDLFWRTLTKDLGELSALDLDDKALQRVKFNIEDASLMSRETIAKAASHIGYAQLFLGGEQGESNLMSVLRQVGKQDMQDVLDQWITPNRMAAVFMVPNGTRCVGRRMEEILRERWSCREDASVRPDVGRKEPEILDLGQGRRIVLAPDPSMPHFSAVLSLHGGEALCSSEEQGLAALTARAITSGTESMSRKALDETLAGMAGELSASVGRTRFRIDLSGPSMYAKDLFSVMGDVVGRPAFPSDEVESEKGRQIAAIRSAEDSPLGLMFRRLPRFLFPEGVYGYTPNGDIADVERYTSRHCRDFWDRQRTRGWVLSVAGCYDREAVVSFAESLPVPADADSMAPVDVVWGGKKDLSLRLRQRNQAHLLLVYPTAPEDSEDTPALKLTAEMLGGMGGPLFKEMRDRRGLGYTVDVFCSQSRDHGYFAFYIGTDTGRLQEAEEAFLKVIEGFGDKAPQAAEVRRGLNHWQGKLLRSGQSLDARATKHARFVSEGKPLTYDRDLMAKARHVTPEALRSVANRYFTHRTPYRITVLP